MFTGHLPRSKLPHGQLVGLDVVLPVNLHRQGQCKMYSGYADIILQTFAAGPSAVRMCSCYFVPHHWPLGKLK